MRLGELVRRLEGAHLAGDPGLEVEGVTHDSRRVCPGWLFAAVKGERVHGISFLSQAVARGAVAVLSDRPRPANAGLAWVTSPHPRRQMALAAWAVAGDPQRDLELVAVTGTNGKSTTADLVARMLERSGRRTGLFGTLGYRVAGEETPAARTTPEATDLAPLLRRLVDDGGEAAVIEVSSHALALDRTAGLELAVAVWTNLSRDHLDFHHDMESYFAVKRRLFDEHLGPDGRRVLPLDDAWGRRLLDSPRGGDVTWGLERGHVHASNVEASLEGTTFELSIGAAKTAVRLPLIGLHNLRNALAAAAAGHAAALPSEAIVGALSSARPLPGRLEPVATGLPCPVFVDYAHTPDGLRAVLASLRAISGRRMVVAFGAGGDRDPGKRRPMGRAVGELADAIVVTNDNPRSEDPALIARAVADGVREGGGEPEIVLDRRRAIARALELADPQSLVVIAGKGHEQVQLVGDKAIPFSDRETVRELAGRVECA